jgi:arsenate reductase (thioredoxin)
VRPKPLILFVCNHNAGRSQMAQAYLRHMASDAFEAVSAGSNPADAVNPIVVEALAEDGIDIAGARPQLVDVQTMNRADRIISMGCKDGCLTRKDEDWELPDPAGQTIDQVREIRDLVKSKVADLVARLA